MSNSNVIIDALQYVNWDRALFEKTRDSGINAVHVTVTYWENNRETLANISQWNRHFITHSDLIMPVRDAADIHEAKRLNKLGIIFGFQNCSPIEDDLGLVQIMYELGGRVMQLSYNNQSLLATGCYEQYDSGITRFGREVIAEMNRVGMVIDMSHSGERSTLQAIELSKRPIAITHANPSFFHDALRNKSDTVLRALGNSDGMFGFSVYPFHLKNGADCTLIEFCQMIADTASLMGIDNVGIGSDLCLNWDYSKLEWMRSGRWTNTADYGEGSADDPAWPTQPSWFKDSTAIMNIAKGLAQQGFKTEDINKVMGDNWLRFFERSFGPIV
ncbi:MAG: microsomal dipeptidase-like Zn-dependent dipeptidase [Halioglobus sp.]|jgi:microsomal dipeptidase-like Zn-dependent dipeptidase